MSFSRPQMGFSKVAKLAEISEQRGKRVVCRDQVLALFKVRGKVYALDDRCSHAGASLSNGLVQGDRVACPLHLAEFSLNTGAALSPPAIHPVKTFAVKIEDGEVFVEVP